MVGLLLIQLGIVRLIAFIGWRNTHNDIGIKLLKIGAASSFFVETVGYGILILERFIGFDEAVSFVPACVTGILVLLW